MNRSIFVLLAGIAVANNDTPASAEEVPHGLAADAVNQEDEPSKFEPAGAKTRDYQYIFDQGTMSFDGFEIFSPIDF